MKVNIASEIRRAEADGMAEPSTSRWRKHHGGPNPYHGASEQPLVRVGFRCRQISKHTYRADGLRWRWGHPFPDDFEYDIVAYRVEAAA